MARTAATFLVVFIMIPLGVEAALIPPVMETVSLSVSPKYPGAHERVVATVSTSGDKSSYAYIWDINGETVAQGAGITTLAFDTGALGDPTEIVVRVVGENGVKKGEATRVVYPAEVDLVWEAQTAVPPFYAGRPLPGRESRISLLAVPFFGGISGDALLYEWEVNGKKLTNESGYGKSSVVVPVPSYQTAFTISVRVSTRSGSHITEEVVRISPQESFAVVYERLPLSGINFRTAAGGTVPFLENEIVFRAYPLFVRNPDVLTYEWDINGTPFINAEAPRYLTLRKEGARDEGLYTVGVNFINTASIFEKGSGRFTVEIP